MTVLEKADIEITLKRLSRFQDLLYSNVYNYERYNDMKPDSNYQLVFMEQLELENLKI